jgi:hypothetical protein
MPTSFGRSDDLQGAEFVETDLSGARFVDVDLSGAVLRGVVIDRAEIDAPWLLGGDGSLVVNGVDVVPLVDAELNRRFPGRELRRATDPEALRSAWAAVEAAWAAVLERAATMPSELLDVSVGGEWSFAQTLRHLVLATDLWIGRSVLGLERPFHPLGLTFAGGEDMGLDMSVFRTDLPTYAEVLEARADRVALVRGFLSTVTADDLAVVRRNPWAPERPETTLRCVQVILQEEWEHLRYATRDLDVIAPGADG